MTESIRQEWSCYMNELYKGQAISRERYQEMRKSFYAGFSCALYFCMKDMQTISEEEGFKIVDNLMGEVKGFIKELSVEIEERKSKNV